jgi:hypothetical protein
MKEYEIVKTISQPEKEPNRQENKHYISKNRHHVFNRNTNHQKTKKDLFNIIEIEVTPTKEASK